MKREVAVVYRLAALCSQRMLRTTAEASRQSMTHGSIFNGMTGAQLKQLRKDLGEAIGRPLSVNDFAKLCGLPPESGGGTILEWEHGYGPIGPVAVLLSMLSVASDHYPIDE